MKLRASLTVIWLVLFFVGITAHETRKESFLVRRRLTKSSKGKDGSKGKKNTNSKSRKSKRNGSKSKWSSGETSGGKSKGERSKSKGEESGGSKSKGSSGNKSEGKSKGDTSKRMKSKGSSGSKGGGKSQSKSRKQGSSGSKSNGKGQSESGSKGCCYVGKGKGGSGIVHEGEKCGADINGGCYSNPPVYGSIKLGQTLVGEYGSVWDSSMGFYKQDADWFLFDVDKPGTCIQATLNSVDPGIVILFEGGTWEASSCSDNLTDVASGDSTGIPAVYCFSDAGEYGVFIAPEFEKESPCKGDPNAYVLMLEQL